jgi:hypothetical protein
VALHYEVVRGFIAVSLSHIKSLQIAISVMRHDRSVSAGTRLPYPGADPVSPRCYRKSNSLRCAATPSCHQGTPPAAGPNGIVWRHALPEGPLFGVVHLPRLEATASAGLRRAARRSAERFGRQALRASVARAKPWFLSRIELLRKTESRKSTNPIKSSTSP